MRLWNGVTVLYWCQNQMEKADYVWIQQGWNQALIRPVHRRPTLYGIFPKLNNAQYLSLIDASSW